MSAYIFRRLLLMIPTLLGIMLLNFIIVQAAPGGPVERMLAQIQGIDSDVQSRLGGSSSEVVPRPTCRYASGIPFIFDFPTQTAS